MTWRVTAGREVRVTAGEVEKQDIDQSGEFVLTAENSINNVSQSDCGVHDAGWVMVDSGASVSMSVPCGLGTP